MVRMNAWLEKLGQVIGARHIGQVYSFSERNCSAFNHKERKEGAKITKKGKQPAIFAHFVISLWSSW
jgi:hypothetical protein